MNRSEIVDACLVRPAKRFSTQMDCSLAKSQMLSSSVISPFPGSRLKWLAICLYCSFAADLIRRCTALMEKGLKCNLHIYFNSLNSKLSELSVVAKHLNENFFLEQ